MSRPDFEAVVYRIGALALDQAPYLSDKILEVISDEGIDLDNIPIQTSPDFWDCECRDRYIHHKSITMCHRCEACSYDCSDSRVNELSNWEAYSEDSEEFRPFNLGHTGPKWRLTAWGVGVPVLKEIIPELLSDALLEGVRDVRVRVDGRLVVVLDEIDAVHLALCLLRDANSLGSNPDLDKFLKGVNFVQGSVL